jgi:hypothetical protein
MAQITLTEKIAASLAGFGGILRCETCRHVRPVSDGSTRTGWPKCCGYTMRWWTQRQIDAGEMP